MTDLVQSIYKKYRDHNRLYSVMMELTYRCICRCIHCYIDEHHSEELSTPEVLDILRQFMKEGTFSLSLTGGEVFLRKDLELILVEANKNGFITSLLTTGILVDESAADMLKRNRVKSVEISLMGARADTHDQIMRYPGAFDKMMNAVRLLKKCGLEVVLKNSILRQNYKELEEMAALAQTLECQFVASLTVLPTIGGVMEPQSYAVDLATALSLNQKLITGGPIPDEDMSGGAILTCNAGKINCAVSPFGDVYPCLIWKRSVGNLRERTLQSIWHDEPDPYLAMIRSSTPEDTAGCFSCPDKGRCRRCPGTSYSETGHHTSKVPSACRLAGHGE